MFGNKNKSSLLFGGGSRTYDSPPDILTRRPPQPEQPVPKLEAIVQPIVHEFRKVQFELAEKYKQSAEELLKEPRLINFAYEYGNYIVIEVPNSLVRRHFHDYFFENREHLRQLKSNFSELNIVVTDINDASRCNTYNYSQNEDRRILLHIEVVAITFNGNNHTRHKLG